MVVNKFGKLNEFLSCSIRRQTACKSPWQHGWEPLKSAQNVHAYAACSADKGHAQVKEGCHGCEGVV
jgi:hypothetical protein